MRMLRRRSPCRFGESGIALVDIIIGMSLLAVATITLTNLFLTAMGQAANAGTNGQAAAWAQAETDYLRGVGYTSACLNPGTTTITSTSSGCTSVQPSLPITFSQATVQVENNALGQTGLKRITILVYRPAGTVFYRVVTYVTQFQ
jgi:hypothetical protein